MTFRRAGKVSRQIDVMGVDAATVRDNPPAALRGVLPLGHVGQLEKHHLVEVLPAAVDADVVDAVDHDVKIVNAVPVDVEIINHIALRGHGLLGAPLACMDPRIQGLPPHGVRNRKARVVRNQGRYPDMACIGRGFGITLVYVGLVSRQTARAVGIVVVQVVDGHIVGIPPAVFEAVELVLLLRVPPAAAGRIFDHRLGIVRGHGL